MCVRFQLKNVRKYYRTRVSQGNKTCFPVLAGVDLKIYENCMNALIGPSGSGKSTLSRVLMGLENHDSGEIIYKGENLRQTSQKAFRRQNQIMFQNPYLSVNPYFRIRKIVTEPLAIQKRNKREIAERMEKILGVLEIDGSYLDRYPHQISGGELQRIVLARALILEPEFLVLDEPFSSLDEIMAARLLKHFKTVFHTLKIGALYISHRLDRVQYLAHHISVIEEGKITFHGKKGAFFAPGP